MLLPMVKRAKHMDLCQCRSRRLICLYALIVSYGTVCMFPECGIVGNGEDPEVAEDEDVEELEVAEDEDAEVRSGSFEVGDVSIDVVGVSIVFKKRVNCILYTKVYSRSITHNLLE